MTLLEKEFYTEREAIELLMLYSYSDGSEFETSIWKARGCLKGGHATLKAVIRKLNCIFNEVRIEDTGQDRKYFLTGLLEQPIKDTGGNNGRPVVAESYLMDEYVFNQLLITKNLGMPRTHKTWARDLHLAQKLPYGSKKMYTMLYELHKDTRGSFRTSKIRSEFINTIETRDIDVVEGAFERLEEAGRITSTLLCNVKRLNGKYEIVTPEEFQRISDSFNAFLSAHDSTLFKYTKLRKKSEPTVKESELLKLAREHLAYDDIDFYFRSYQVKIIDKTVHTPMTRDEYDSAYFDRLITLTEHRQEKYIKEQRDFFWQIYYKLNTFAILRHIGIQGLDEAIEEELNKRPQGFGNTSISENKTTIGNINITNLDLPGMF